MPIAGSKLGKNNLANTRVAAVPYSVKSYHSIMLPTTLANMIRRNEADATGAVGAARLDDMAIIRDGVVRLSKQAPCHDRGLGDQPARLELVLPPRLGAQDIGQRGAGVVQIGIAQV